MPPDSLMKMFPLELDNWTTTTKITSLQHSPEATSNLTFSNIACYKISDFPGRNSDMASHGPLTSL